VKSKTSVTLITSDPQTGPTSSLSAFYQPLNKKTIPTMQSPVPLLPYFNPPVMQVPTLAAKWRQTDRQRDGPIKCSSAMFGRAKHPIIVWAGDHILNRRQSRIGKVCSTHKCTTCEVLVGKPQVKRPQVAAYTGVSIKTGITQMHLVIATNQLRAARTRKFITAFTTARQRSLS
jgi:hypothetical protein